MRIFDDNRFLGLLDTRLLGRRLVHLKVTASTNDHAAGIIDNMTELAVGDAEGTIVLADEQTGGRGRFNRQWLSPPGGLWFSLIVKTELSQDRIPAVTLIAAFAAAQALTGLYGIKVNVRWPNDLYSGDRKFGGILSESKNAGTHKFIIMGMGLNIDVDEKSFRPLRGRAVNIQDLAGEKIDKERLLADILRRFEDLYTYYACSGDLDSIFKRLGKMLRF